MKYNDLLILNGESDIRMKFMTNMEELRMTLQENGKRMNMTEEEKLLEKIDLVIESTCEKMQTILSGEIIPSEAIEALANLINARASFANKKYCANTHSESSNE